MDRQAEFDQIQMLRPQREINWALEDLSILQLSGKLEIASCIFPPEGFASPDETLNRQGYLWTDNVNAWEIIGHQGGPLFAQFTYEEDGRTNTITSEVYVDPVPKPANWWKTKSNDDLVLFAIPRNQPEGFIKDIKDGVGDVIDGSKPVFARYLDSKQTLSLSDPPREEFRILIKDSQYNGSSWLFGFVKNILYNIGTGGLYGTTQVVLTITEAFGLTSCSSPEECLGSSGPDSVNVLVYSEKHQVPIIVKAKDRGENGFFSTAWIHRSDITDSLGDSIYVVYSPKDRYITAVLNVEK